ncbi:MAG: hypothetical protein ACUZ8E_17405 [Candidatus Anammoxibacter sp.]
MRVSIIPEDNIVVIDGQARNITLDIDPNIHAIQWHGDYGYVENKTGDNLKITDFVGYQYIVDEFYTQETEEENKKKKQIDDAAKPLAVWERDMLVATGNMSDILEDIIGAFSETQRNKLSTGTLDNYNTKRDLRAEKPE